MAGFLLKKRIVHACTFMTILCYIRRYLPYLYNKMKVWTTFGNSKPRFMNTLYIKTSQTFYGFIRIFILDQGYTSYNTETSSFRCSKKMEETTVSQLMINTSFQLLQPNSTSELYIYVKIHIEVFIAVCDISCILQRKLFITVQFF